MVTGVISSRIWREATRGAVLKSLVHRQNHHLASPCQAAMIQHTRQIGAYTRILTGIPAENLTNTIVHHFLPFPLVFKRLLTTCIVAILLYHEKRLRSSEKVAPL